MSTEPHAKAITTDTFAETVGRPGIVLLDFWAEWCGPCRRFAPVFEDAASRHPDALFGKIDTEREVELAQALRIRSIPTLMVFRDGVLVFSQPGMLPGAALDELIAQVQKLDMVEVMKRARPVQSEATPHTGEKP